MSEHTKEPWYASQEGGEWRVMASDENGGYTLADICCDNKEANARRIVACVNACAGITNEQLGNVCAVSGNLLNRFAEQKAALGQVEKQRDELLAAAKAVSEKYHKTCGSLIEVMDGLNAAIVSVKDHSEQHLGMVKGGV